MQKLTEIKKIGIQYNDMQKESKKITKSSMYNIMNTYNLQENGCSASATFGKVSTVVSFSIHWGSLNCFSFLKPKFYL